MNNICFNESNHTYVIDGKILPSVTQIIDRLFPNEYENIPKSILNEKANFGTNVHSAIEMHEKNLPILTESIYEELCFKEYLNLKEEYDFKPFKNEMIIWYKDKYAGRLDMLADINNRTCLFDIKTTAKLETSKLEWQLGMYKLALEDTFNLKVDECYCIWLPKGELGELVKINPIEKEQIEVVL